MEVESKEDIRELKGLAACFVVDNAQIVAAVGVHHIHPVHAAADGDILARRELQRVGGNVAADFQLAVGNLKVALLHFFDQMAQKQPQIAAEHLQAV